jgi:ribonucleoside-triphosphate reductase (formate)
MNEALLNFMGADISNPEARAFAGRVLDHMRERLIGYQETTGELFNLEATPAESTSYRLAKHDRERFADIISAGEEHPYYTNSTQLPVGYTEDIFDALDLQDELQTKYTGGTVFHAFLGEAIHDPAACAELVRVIAQNYRLPYFTISPTFSICPEHGYLAGEHHSCPHCGKETEVYSRIVGYYRSLKNWNNGKRNEFAGRRTFVVNES